MTDESQQAIATALDQVSGVVLNEADGLEKIALLDALISEIPEGLPWASLQVAKANVLNRMPGQSVGLYLDQAIACYQAALRYRTPAENPENWRRTLSNLGVAWRRRLTGEKALNLEEALSCYQAIDQGSKGLEKDRLWASTQANLANVWLDRIMGDKRDNIEKARHHYEQALTVFTQTDYPALWARCTGNLAHLYQERIVGDREVNLEQAIDLHQQALSHWDNAPHDTEWARIHNNLGASYRNRLKGNLGDNYEHSLDHYQQALTVWTKEHFADDWARTQLNLGIVYRYRRHGDMNNNLRLATEHLTACLSVRTPEKFPQDWIRAQHSLALAYAEQRDWGALVQLREMVMPHVSTLMQSTESLYEQRRLAGLVSAIKNLSVWALSRQTSPEQAYQVLMQGRGLIARQLRNALVTQKKEPLLPQAVCRLPKQNEVIITFCQLPLDHEPMPLFVVYPYHNVIKTHLIPLTLLTKRALDVLMDNRAANGQAVDDFITAYQGLKTSAKINDFKQALVGMLDALEQALDPLWQRLAVLPNGITRLTIRHSGLLSLVPFAALKPLFVDRLLDRFDITYDAGIPDKTISPQTSQPMSKRSLFVVSNPTGDLPYSQEEGQWLSQLIANHTHLTGNASSRSALIQAFTENTPYTHWHFACHGHFQWRDAEQSGLQLSHKENLTFSDIVSLGRFAGGSLVVLSACETGMTEYRELPDESYGLPLAFLIAGAKTVVSTLWPVPDQATQLLMLKFYQTLIEGKSPEQALREAQQWLSQVTWRELSDYTHETSDVLRSPIQLRWTQASTSTAEEGEVDKKPFEHPFYWAGFGCYQ